MSFSLRLSMMSWVGISTLCSTCLLLVGYRLADIPQCEMDDRVSRLWSCFDLVLGGRFTHAQRHFLSLSERFVDDNQVPVVLSL